MEIGIAVTIALAIATALCGLAYNDVEGFRELYRKADTPLLCIAVFGIGVMCASIMRIYGLDVLNTGAVISASALGTALFAGLLAWLRRNA